MPAPGFVEGEGRLIEVTPELPVGLKLGGVQFVEVDGPVDPDDANSTKPAGGEGPGKVRVGRSRDQRGDAELFGSALDPAGEVHRVPERPVLELARAARVADQCGAGIDAD